MEEAMKRYNKAMAFFAAALATFMLVPALGCTGPRNECPTPCPTGEIAGETPTASAAPTPSYEAASSPSGGKTCLATIYFNTDEGYTLPVIMSIPWEEGIAKACLNKLIKNDANRLELQKQGLVGVIPDGTGIELNIRDGHATVNLLEMARLPSAEAEQAMFVSIVNTLIQFPSVENVTILLDGRQGTTPNGNPTPVNQGLYKLNVETSDIATSGNAEAITLYFPNNSGSLNIPITRYISGTADLYTCMSSLISGTELPSLVNCFPDGTILLGAVIDNGILSVNLSSDFKAVSETPGLLELACSSLLLTAQEYGSVDEVIVLVNGEEYGRLTSR